MIRNILFSLLLTHSALVAQGKPSRIILQTPPEPVPIEPIQANVIPPPEPPIAPEPPVVEQTIITNAQGTTAPPGSNAPPQEVPATPVTPATPGSSPAAPQGKEAAGGGQGTPSVPAPEPPQGTTAPDPVVILTDSPTTDSPTTESPTTDQPTTGTPTTGTPTTGTPTTASPTLAPLPAGYEYGTWGQACPEVTNPQDCTLLGDQIFSNNINRIITCDRRADCCKCGSIQCGNAAAGQDSHGCHQFMAGDYGAYGVKAVSVIGNPADGGSEILCSGFYACADTNIFGDSINNLMCNVDNSCQGALIQIDNPADLFWIDCNGPESCKDLKVIVNVGLAPPEGQQCNPLYHNERRFGGIKCNAPHACDGLDITINNRGCDEVIFGELNCLQTGACSNANFLFNGNIEIENCLCGPSCGFASGLGKCFQNLERLICPDIRSCMNMVKTILNPKNLFYLECSNELSCAMADITIELEQDPTSPDFATSAPTRIIDALKFTGINAGRGTTVHIHNHQLIDPLLPGSGVQVIIRILECSASNSCQGLTIYTGENVEIQNIICGQATSCLGCLIKKDVTDPGVPCNPNPLPVIPQNPPAPQIPQFIPQQPQGPPQFVPQQPGVPAPPQNPVTPQNPPQNPPGPQVVPQIPQGPPQFVPRV